METPKRCVLTGTYFDPSVKFHNSNPLIVDYEFRLVGRARIALPTYNAFVSNRNYLHPKLAGICRNAFEGKLESPLINADFITNGIDEPAMPTNFKQKSRHLLKFIFDRGGNEYQSFDLRAEHDYTLCYSESIDEFNRIMDSLESTNLIKWHDASTFGRNLTRYHAVQLTEYGIAEIEKDLPVIPLYGLVSQVIATGDQTIDDRINHAKKLFFEEPKSTDKMRSACETLSYILEPLRNDLSKYFTQKDVNDFFQIVNTFDIRHNKETTKNLLYEEQLEWVFYSLLNTINSYTKLTRRFESPQIRKI